MEASSLHLRHRPPEEQQQQKTNSSRTVDTGKPNPNLQSLLVASGIYTGRPIRGSPQPPAPARPPEAERIRRIRRRIGNRPRFALLEL